MTCRACSPTVARCPDCGSPSMGGIHGCIQPPADSLVLGPDGRTWREIAEGLAAEVARLTRAAEGLRLTHAEAIDELAACLRRAPPNRAVIDGEIVDL